MAGGGRRLGGVTIFVLTGFVVALTSGHLVAGNQTNVSCSCNGRMVHEMMVHEMVSVMASLFSLPLSSIAHRP